MRGFVSKRRSMPAAAHSCATMLFPGNAWISLHHASSSLSDCFKSGFQSLRCHTTSSTFLIHSKAWNSPQLLCSVFKRQRSIISFVVDARQLFSRPILAPTHRLSICVNQDPVRAPFFDELFFVKPVPHPLVPSASAAICSWATPRSLKMHAPAKIPAIPLREQSHKIEPSSYRQLHGCICLHSHTQKVSEINVAIRVSRTRKRNPLLTSGLWLLGTCPRDHIRSMLLD